MKKILSTALLSVMIPGFVAQAQPCETVVQQKVNFKSNETLFVVLAWLNWVGDREEPLKLSHYDPIQTELLQDLKQASKLKALYPKHRQAYDAYLKGADLYSKNGLLLADSVYYGDAPAFVLPPKPVALDAFEKQRLSELPAPQLLNEFYRSAQLGQLWKTKYKAVHDKYLNTYKASALKGMTLASCFLKLKPQAPVDISINPLDAFGTSGQMSYNNQTKRYWIKLHVDTKYTKQESVLDTATHEYTHVLTNHLWKPHQKIFETKLKETAKIAGEPALAQIPIQELFARSVGYLRWAKDYPASYLDNIVYTGKNPIYFYLIDSQTDYQKSGGDFLAYMPNFVKQYQPQSAAQKYLQAKRRVAKFQTSQPDQVSPAIQKYGFDAQALKSALLPLQSEFQQKMGVFVSSSGADMSNKILWDMVNEGFSQAQYFESDIEIKENVYRIYKNPLFIHLSELIAQHKSKPMSSIVFAKALVSGFDPHKEAKRWKSVEARFKAEDEGQ